MLGVKSLAITEVKGQGFTAKLWSSRRNYGSVKVNDLILQSWPAIFTDETLTESCRKLDSDQSQSKQFMILLYGQVYDSETGVISW